MAVVPQSITDQITDQNTPYCSELGDGAINDIRMLEVIRFLDKASNPSSGHHNTLNNTNKPSKYSGITSHRTTFGTVLGTALSGSGLK